MRICWVGESTHLGWFDLNEDNMLVNLGWVDLNEDIMLVKLGLVDLNEDIMLVNLGWVNLNIKNTLFVAIIYMSI